MAFFEVKKIIKVGNSYAVTISKPQLTALALAHNDHVTIRLTGDKLEIQKLKGEGK